LTHGTSRQTPFQSLSNRHNNVGSHAKPHSVTITRRSGLYTAWVKTLVHVVAYAYTALFLIPLGAPGRDRSVDEPGAELARGMAGAGRVRTGRAAGVGVRSR
jgi:hypothetical protein